jgi:hypothetical protein
MSLREHIDNLNAEHLESSSYEQAQISTKSRRIATD